MNKASQNAMNDQIRHELESAYVYLSMAAYCESVNMTGAAHWMRLQAQEELDHAMRFFDHIIDRGGRVILQAIEQPPGEFESLLDVFQGALAHEQKVTGLINQIYDLAVQEKDYPAQALLQWFVVEQVEEEKSAGEVVATLEMIGDDPAALYALDRELGTRVPEEE
ncbi:MAG: ferritin [Anaerolineae bacterium]